MKKPVYPACILAISIFLFFQSLVAKSVSFQTAQQVALQKLTEFTPLSEVTLESSAEIHRTQAAVLGYVFFLKPHGYIVVAADTRIRPVIAHSISSDFGEMSAADNPLLQILITDLENRLENAAHLSPEIFEKHRQQWEQCLNSRLSKANGSAFEQWPPPGTTTTGGWLKTQWNQDDPYNRNCPLDAYSLEKEQQQRRSVAGCPAIAMAQILNYFQTINHTRFDDQDDYIDATYRSQGVQYCIDDDWERLDFPSFPQLNAQLEMMELRLENRRLLNTANRAALIFACGIAAKQVYTVQVSGTYNVRQAHNAYLRFGFTNARLYPTGTPDSVLFPHLSQNMKDARPAHLAIVTPQWDAGHNLVVDGYNTNEEYHLNFGWKGLYDGWYALPDASIPGYAFKLIEGVIVDIHTLLETGIEPIQNTRVMNYTLDNYPNPFNPVTTIEYTLPCADQVVLHVYDLLGSEIIKLVEGPHSAGKYRLPFHAHNLPSGIYFYRLTSGDFTATKRMLLLK